VPARILIAEDDHKQADVVRRFLQRDGHQPTVVLDGRSAIQEARRRHPDLLILDLMLPEIDGLDVCRVLRTEQDLPIIMLTARTSEDDLVLGLALGADDYVTKPYSPRELTARVGTVLRRAARTVSIEQQPYLIGDLEIDLRRHEVRTRDESIDLTRAEFNLLACLASSPGRTFTRELLLEHASELGREATARTIDFHIMNLRRKIEPSPTRPVIIRTVYGIGYKLAEPATDIDHETH
jgi:DNA-binding response OmpR family regulator